MRKILVFFMTLGFVCLETYFAAAQGQQLKTFHHFQGKTDIEGLTYMGYEDELGNITPHGSFTYNNGTVSATLNYKNGKLDGAGSYADTKSGMTCKVKYKDGHLLEINYRQEKYQYYLYNDAMSGKLTHGPIVLKCSLNEQGLPIGDFELTFIAPYENIVIKGKFDNSGKATGFWTKQDNMGYGNMGNKVYFEQGYCLGNDELKINLGRKYFLEKSITVQDLKNKGYYSGDHDKIYLKYTPCSSSYDRNPEQKKGSIQEMLSDELHSMRYHIKHHAYYLELENLDSVDFSDAFVGVLWGNTINYMSADLYQNIVNQIKNNNLQTTIYYDVHLEKSYILKVDGESRLYIPLESENDFNGLYGYKNEPCPETMKDYDGNTYNTVQIGKQCWMKENLRTTHYADGSAVTYRYTPDDKESNVPKYGFLYTWPAVMHGANSGNYVPSHIQGICPNGWHVPSDAEWDVLKIFVGNQSENVCEDDYENYAKSFATTYGWKSSDESCAIGNIPNKNNTTGFSVLPAGYNSSDSFGYFALFWTATEYNDYKSEACNICLRYDRAYTLWNTNSKDMAFSVRCVKN